MCQPICDPSLCGRSSDESCSGPSRLASNILFIQEVPGSTPSQAEKKRRKELARENIIIEPLEFIPFPPKITVEEVLMLNKNLESKSKPPNRFFIFRMYYVRELHRQGRTYSQTALSRTIGRCWRKLPEYKKDCYGELAYKARMLFREKHGDNVPVCGYGRKAAPKDKKVAPKNEKATSKNKKVASKNKNAAASKNEEAEANVYKPPCESLTHSQDFPPPYTSTLNNEEAEAIVYKSPCESLTHSQDFPPPYTGTLNNEEAEANVYKSPCESLTLSQDFSPPYTGTLNNEETETNAYSSPCESLTLSQGFSPPYTGTLDNEEAETNAYRSPCESLTLSQGFPLPYTNDEEAEFNAYVSPLESPLPFTSFGFPSPSSSYYANYLSPCPRPNSYSEFDISGMTELLMSPSEFTFASTPRLEENELALWEEYFLQEHSPQDSCFEIHDY
ncbi:2003_t:CDS:1 [Acaulospora colombiana]|uniref:2003_t:CDS:1 n=1 Tax=Acaulospora colombiana TaxID=27376 RepID=A0ACA9L460_9GLOM|nr:2003_t:CDS:1 [Acaulospora colombiana]